ncbi:MAG: metal ABC transporter substrate-binding protein [Oscillibacter sp.]|nr:metal ABC transporter substrate-binding protein [Oscillibacter sp.]
MKKIIACLLAGLILAVTFSACGAPAASTSASSAGGSGKLSVVCTNFPEYDFVRQIAGGKADITMLLKPGAESHSYEPTPQDIITIQNSDLFVYVGGDSDAWVADVLSSMDQSKMTVFKLMDCVDLVEEELVEGMQPEAEESESNTQSEAEEAPEMDEHVWTAPANAMKIVQKLSDTLCTLDAANQDTYKANTKTYLAQLQKLDGDFRQVIDNSKRKEIIVGDRFPFRYFCEEFGLTYYAAFPGCSTDTEADASTVAFLIDKVKEDQIPVVFHIELSNEQMCDSICEATGAKSELLNAVHNVSGSDFKAGVTYVSLMEHNVEVLKEALN